MEKNMYNLLNEVEIDLSQYKEEGFDDMEKKRIKNHFKNHIKKNIRLSKKGFVAASVALLMIGLISINLESSVFANITSHIASLLGIEKNLDEYKTAINQTITKNGVTVGLNEVILDHDELVVSNTVVTEEKIKKEASFHIDSTIYVNGKAVLSGAGGFAGQIDDHTVEELMIYDLEDVSLSGDVNIKIVYSHLRLNGEKKPGKWVFEFKTNGDELTIDTREILLDKSFNLDIKQKVTLEKYTSNHLGQKVYYSKEGKGKRVDYDMLLKGEDDLGNEVSFYMARETDGKGVFKLSNINNGNLNENAKKITLTPYAVKFPEKSDRLSNDFEKVGEAFTIDLTQK